jgi:transforming growth factor-beta-induced protein
MKRASEFLTMGWTAIVSEFHQIQLKTINNNQMKTKNLFETVKSRFSLITVLFLFLGITVFTSCDNDDDEMMDMEMEKSIVDVAAEAGTFNVLIQAAQKAGLADFLSTEQNITVFAPTDAAFAALLNDLGASSLDDLDAATLASVLTYHVVSGTNYSKNLSSGVLPSLNTSSPDNEALSLLVNVGSDVMINKAKVTSPDLMASNGVIHVIDKVLLPPSVVDIATYSNDFSSLVSAVVKADLVETLNGDGPFTVFAPTNDAFTALYAALKISGLEEVGMDDLTSILTYHVLGDNVLSSEISAGTVKSVSGEDLEITIDGAVILNGTIKVTATDIQGTNGVVHVIDAVLVP